MLEVSKINIYRTNNALHMHLFCLISKGTEKREKYSGLAHVTEHACLNEKGRARYNLDHFQAGYTCLSHMCLFYSSLNDFKWIEKTSQQIYTGQIITKRAVARAKADVLSECISMQDITFTREKIVRFITEGRISHSIMGNPDEVEKIHFLDVQDYLESVVQEKKVYLVKYRDKQEVKTYFEKVLSNFNYADVLTTQNSTTDDFLYLTENSICTVEVFIKITNLDKGTFFVKPF